MDIVDGTVQGSMEDGGHIGAMVGAGMILGTMIGAGAILIMVTGAGVAMVPIGVGLIAL